MITPRVRTRITSTEKRVLLLLFLCLGAIVLLYEPFLFSLVRGSHFNWVPIHSLAIVKHTGFGSALVGYSCRILDQESGMLKFDYFNRYSPFFPVVAKIFLMPFAGSSPLFLYAAKQLLNIIFLATCLFLYLGCRIGGFSVFASSSGVLAAMSSPLWLHYRPLFHFDQPGLLALSVVIPFYLIWLRIPETTGGKLHRLRFVVLVSIAALFGRAYIVILFLVGASLVPRRLSTGPRKETRLALVAGACAGSLLIGLTSFYSALVESRMNSGPLSSTSILDSAGRRLGFATSSWSSEIQARLSWPNALERFSESTQTLLPAVPLLLLAGFILLIAGLNLWRKRSDRLDPACASVSASSTPSRSFGSELIFSLALVSVLWLFLFKNLVVFHDYTFIFLIPLFCLGYAMVVDSLCQARILRSVAGLMPVYGLKIVFLVTLGISMFVNYQGSVQAWTMSPAQETKILAFFNEVDRYNRLTSQPIPLDQGWIHNSPYAQCLFFDESLSRNSDPGDPIQAPPPFPLNAAVIDALAKQSKTNLRNGSLQPLLMKWFDS